MAASSAQTPATSAGETGSNHGTPTLPAPAQPENKLKRKRGRLGCLNCRRKRKKCDEVKPTCTKCSKHGDTCEWDTGVVFRHNSLSIEHPSMREFAKNGPTHQQDFTIIDVTPSVVRSCREDGTSPRSHDSPDVTPQESEHREGWIWQGNPDESTPSAGTVWSRTADQSRPTSDVHSPVQSHNGTAGRFNATDVPLSDTQSRMPPYRSPGASDIASMDHTQVLFRRQMSSDGVPRNGEDGRNISSEGTVDPGNLSRTSSLSHYPTFREPIPISASQPSRGVQQFNLDNHTSGLSAGELAALDFLTSQPQQNDTHGVDAIEYNQSWASHEGSADVASAFSTDPGVAESPDILGLYYPSSAYKDLQQNLHSHILETARNTGLTRQGTPDSLIPGASLSRHSEAATISGVTERLETLAQAPPQARYLTEQREVELWQNYMNEVAPWLDKFDNQRHFQFTIPILAKTCAHLRYSALALSARQQERKDPSRPYTESLRLYQEAIQNLVPELQTMSTAVIASSVLLCVLEMIIVSPKDWGRHLDGCAILLQAANITGVSGGVNQALFWCFARMDVWGGYLSDSCTKVPLDRWLSSSIPMSAAVNLFKIESKGFDAYANYAVFLSASVVNVINSRGDASSETGGGGERARAEFASRWKALFDLVEDWYESRPIEMQPLLSYPAAFDDYNYPFPKVLYGNPAALNGNQLYHFCAIRLLQEKPKEVRLNAHNRHRNSRSVIWHARQICGIAASNTHLGALINGLQPLWVAGKLMSHPSEHRAILNILARIENESGWATKWRADELREYWGDYAE